MPRQLVLRHEDRVSAEEWIAGVARDFSGYVWVSKPDYMVEVLPRASTECDDDDDDEAHVILVSIDTDITVVACEVPSGLNVLLITSAKEDM